MRVNCTLHKVRYSREYKKLPPVVSRLALFVPSNKRSAANVHGFFIRGLSHIEGTTSDRLSAEYYS